MRRSSLAFSPCTKYLCVVTGYRHFLLWVVGVATSTATGRSMGSSVKKKVHCLPIDLFFPYGQKLRPNKCIYWRIPVRKDANWNNSNIPSILFSLTNRCSGVHALRWKPRLPRRRTLSAFPWRAKKRYIVILHFSNLSVFRRVPRPGVVDKTLLCSHPWHGLNCMLLSDL